jgi:hypothetical protein
MKRRSKNGAVGAAISSQQFIPDDRIICKKAGRDGIRKTAVVKTTFYSQADKTWYLIIKHDHQPKGLALVRADRFNLYYGE